MNHSEKWIFISDIVKEKESNNLLVLSVQKDYEHNVW